MRIAKSNLAIMMIGTAMLAAKPVSAGQVAQSPQSLFDAAQAAYDRDDWPGAVVGYRATLAVMKPTARSAPIIHARLAYALRYSGQFSAAEEEAKASIKGFAAQGVTKHEDLSFSYIALGNLHRGGSQNAQAITEYQQAIAAMTGTNVAKIALGPRYGLATASVTAQPDLAASTLDEILGDKALFATFSKKDQASIYSLRALAELNRGNAKLASTYINTALSLTGRDTTRVDINQVQIRGNAALIYAKLGDQENVRHYLTYSGAGHLPDDNWLSAAEKELPVCDDDVRPQDFAVVEFSIGDDGHVRGADPVYASRTGVVGAVFAAAVDKWHWRPEALAKLNGFWRSSIRIELRCVKRPPLLAISDAFRDATARWFEQKGYDAELAKGTFDPKTGGEAAVPRAFVAMWKANDDRALAEAGGALNAALTDAQAPPEVRAFALFLEASPQGARAGRAYHAAHARTLTNALATYGQPAGGERAGAWLRTEQGLALEASGSLAPARAALQYVVSMPLTTLPEDDPVRSLAVLHLSLIDKRSGATALADKRIADAGLDAEQCSLLDVRPVAQNTAISSSAFPAEAMNWHFEGNVREAFDIAADGHVQDVRTVLSYPPFVFGPATEKAVAQFRYLPPTLGNQVLGCIGQTVNVNYRLPD